MNDHVSQKERRRTHAALNALANFYSGRARGQWLKTVETWLYGAGTSHTSREEYTRSLKRKELVNRICGYVLHNVRDPEMLPPLWRIVTNLQRGRDLMGEQKEAHTKARAFKSSKYH